MSRWDGALKVLSKTPKIIKRTPKFPLHQHSVEKLFPGLSSRPGQPRGRLGAGRSEVTAQAGFISCWALELLSRHRAGLGWTTTALLPLLPAPGLTQIFTEPLAMRHGQSSHSSPRSPGTRADSLGLAAQLLEASSTQPKFFLAGEKGSKLQGQHEVTQGP